MQTDRDGTAGRRQLTEEERRDVDYAKRQLDKGTPRQEVIDNISKYQKDLKPQAENPEKHALYCVRRASYELKCEQDLTYAKTQLDKGLDRDKLTERIAKYRSDFPDPQGHAQYTVIRAEKERVWDRELNGCDRERIATMLRDGASRDDVRRTLAEQKKDFPEVDKYASAAVYQVSRELRTDDDILNRRVITADNSATVRTADYIKDNFKPDDRLAVLYIGKDEKGVDHVRQEIVTAAQMAEPKYLGRMNWFNEQGNNVYVSMNTLKENASGRKADDIAEIRHVYLDIDHDGRKGLDAVLKSNDLPKPSYVINTSPEKYQVIWKVEGMSRQDAEKLNDALVRNTGADDKVKDIARVLRVPGYDNQKYDVPFRVQAVQLSEGVYTKNDFKVQVVEQRIEQPRAEPAQSGPAQTEASRVHDPERSTTPVTQSEKDWAYARRAVSRGDDLVNVKEAILKYREGDNKRDLVDYVNRTADKAYAIHALQRGATEPEIRAEIKRCQVQRPEADYIDRYLDYIMRQAHEYVGKERLKTGPTIDPNAKMEFDSSARMRGFGQETPERTLKASGPEMGR